MKAYAYVRVSSKVQVSGNGFDRQEEMILSYSRQSGYEIVGFVGPALWAQGIFIFQH